MSTPNIKQAMTRLCVLPVAGKEDPGQLLRMEGWRTTGRYEVMHGVHGRFFAGTRTCLKYRPDLLYFDWIGRYVIGRNMVVSWAKMLAFIIDVQIVAKIFRRPIVWTLHNLRSHENSEHGSWERWMQRYFASQASLIRVFSRSSVTRACAALELGEDKICVVAEGDFSGYYPNATTRAQARSRLGLGMDELVLLWLGSIRPYKGLHELIDAFHQTAQPDWRLVIAGKPFIQSYAAEIAAQIQGDPRIQFHPTFIAENELQIYYNAADAVVLPFVEVENSGSVCVAMGFCKPIVAPNLGVIGERLRHQPELVYRPGGLSEALKRLASLPSARRTEIGADNLREIKSYHWDGLAPFFQELTSTTSPSA